MSGQSATASGPKTWDQHRRCLRPNTRSVRRRARGFDGGPPVPETARSTRPWGQCTPLPSMSQPALRSSCPGKITSACFNFIWPGQFGPEKQRWLTSALYGAEWGSQQRESKNNKQKQGNKRGYPPRLYARVVSATCHNPCLLWAPPGTRWVREHFTRTHPEKSVTPVDLS